VNKGYFLDLIGGSSLLPAETVDILAKAVIAGDTKSALATLQTVRQQHPNDPQLLFFESQLLVSTGQTKEARSLLEQAWKAKQRDPRIIAALSQVWLDAAPNRLDEIVNDLPTAGATSLLTPLNGIAVPCAIYASLDTERADKVAKETLKEDQMALAAYYEKTADIETLDRNLVAAAARLEMALATDNTNRVERLRKMLGIYASRQNHNKIQEYSKALLQIHADDQQALDVLSIAEFRLGNLIESKAAVERLIKLQNPPEPRLHKRLRQLETKMATGTTSAEVAK
jgi:Flp pilus assembly protein TadD